MSSLNLSRTSAIDALGAEASDTAMRAMVQAIAAAGQVEFLRSDVGSNRAVVILRELAREAAVKALADAREALEASPGLGAVAAATFRAEMTLAGLTAAKVWLEEVR